MPRLLRDCTAAAEAVEQEIGGKAALNAWTVSLAISRLRNLPFSLRMVFLSNAFVTGENDVNAQSTGFSPIASAFLPTISGVPQQARIKEPGSLRQAKRPDENRPISLKCTSQFALNVIYTNKSTVFVLAVSAPRFIDALHN